MLLAVAAFSCMDTMLKLFAQHYPPMEVAFLRGLASLPFMALPALIKGRYRDLKPQRIWMHLLRGLLMVVMLGAFIYSVRTLSLASAYSIFLAEPLIVTALAALLLGDRVGWRNWIAISVGLVAATAYALSMTALRVISHTDSTTSVIVWTVGLMTVITGLIAVPHWVALAPEHWKWVAGLGLFGAIGQHLLTEAFRSAPTAVVAPFEYTALLWGILIDWTVWNVLPATRVYVGGGIVIASGLYLIWHERSQQNAFDKSCAATPAP
jgi:drug/metabolite transporter (DMT)-like permease